ncbi:YsnF/AvaK domain-containing protein [Ectobacillus funiculus]|uniref:YsnF/AvaK domain-containing protein n=1 Tax=Ectobacillus funiculus TaxID=137993 RepID=UPI00397E0445
MSDLTGLSEERNHEVEINEIDHTVNDGKLLLHQEELDISKNRIQAGEVILSKGIVEEPKTVEVSVAHEEVVIERRPVDNEPSDSPISSEEVIRIPVSEEHIQVGKHTVVTEEISAYKRDVEETRQVQETLKREEAYIETDGHPHIIKD